MSLLTQITKLSKGWKEATSNSNYKGKKNEIINM